MTKHTWNISTRPTEGTATHGPDCRKASGEHVWQSAVNNIINRALHTAGVPPQLEPVGLSLNDGKRPDGATIVPSSQGRCFVWDFTCINIVAASHIGSAVSQVGVSNIAIEKKKRNKYDDQGNLFKFTPVTIETLGPLGPSADTFVTELGKLLSVVSGDPRSADY